MTVLCDDQGPPTVGAPHDAALLFRVVSDGIVVCLRKELVVDDPLRENEPVPLLLPQPNLVGHRGRQLRLAVL